MSFWLNIFMVFSGETWGYFLLTILVSGTVLYVLYKYHHHPENWGYCVAVGFFLSISIPVPLNPKHQTLRLYFFVFCLYGILLTTTFNSLFLSIIAKPLRYNQISTRDSLVSNSMKLFAENETIAMYRNSESEVRERKPLQFINRKCFLLHFSVFRIFSPKLSKLH